MEKGRVLYFEGPKRVSLRDEAIHKKPDEVWVDSTLVGISHGTEMTIYRGEFPREEQIDSTISSLPGTFRYPMKYGYINVGVLENSRRVFAFFPHQDRFCIPEEALIYLDRDITDRDAIFIPNMETAVSILQDLNVIPGGTVLVCGQGVVGLLLVELLSSGGTSRLITIDKHNKKTAFSESLGAEAILSCGESHDELVGKVLAFTEGRGVDAAVNISGSAGGLQIALDTLSFGGTAIEASWYGNQTTSLQLGSAFHRKRLTIKSSQVSTIPPALSGSWDKKRRMQFVLDWVKKIQPQKYITHTYPFGQAASAFELIDKHPDEVLQVVLDPRGG